ncbi:tyrosine 3-monooxygenase, partial [Gautieria morchelliformis]
TWPRHLVLALNFSFCYDQLLDDPVRACHLAKYAFDDAVEAMYALGLPQDVLATATPLLLQLKDNMTFWLERISG